MKKIVFFLIMSLLILTIFGTEFIMLYPNGLAMKGDSVLVQSDTFQLDVPDTWCSVPRNNMQNWCGSKSLGDARNLPGPGLLHFVTTPKPPPGCPADASGNRHQTPPAAVWRLPPQCTPAAPDPTNKTRAPPVGSRPVPVPCGFRSL